MLEYERLKKDRRQLLALTGLTRKEFVALHQAFRTAYATVYPEDKTADGSVRKRQVGGGRKGQWRTTEQLWNKFHNGSYRSPHIMEGHRARGHKPRLYWPRERFIMMRLAVKRSVCLGR